MAPGTGAISSTSNPNPSPNPNPNPNPNSNPNPNPKPKPNPNQVKLLQDGQELAIKNAELMAQQGVQDKLLTRYMQGLRDGASLSAGQGMSPPVNAPPWSGA